MPQGRLVIDAGSRSLSTRRRRVAWYSRPSVGSEHGAGESSDFHDA